MNREARRGRDKVRSGLTACAATWFADHLVLNERGEGSSIGPIGFAGRETKMLTDPGYWEINGDDSQYGGVHLYTAKCHLKPSNDVAELEVIHLVPEGLMFVQSGRFHERDEDNNETEKHTFGATGFKLLTEVREEAIALRVRTREAIVEWYKASYDLLEDSDIGTEGRDWEQLTHERASINKKTMKSTWLRMKARNDDGFLDSETEPGVVVVITEADGNVGIAWLIKPTGKYAMSWATKYEAMGVWA